MCLRDAGLKVSLLVLDTDSLVYSLSDFFAENFEEGSNI
jgi:hypothetical protein